MSSCASPTFPLASLPAELIHHIMEYVDIDTVCALLDDPHGDDGDDEGVLKELAAHAHRNTLHWLEEFHKLCDAEVPVGSAKYVAEGMERLQGLPHSVLRVVLGCVTSTDDEELSERALWWKMDNLVVVYEGQCFPPVKEMRNELLVVVGDTDLKFNVPIGDSLIVLMGDSAFMRKPVAGYGGNRILRVGV